VESEFAASRQGSNAISDCVVSMKTYHALLVIGLLALMSCTPRGQITLDPAAAEVGAVQKVFVGTTRKPEADGSFGGGRSEMLRFARFDVAIPPDREVGEINWPPKNGPVNARRQFVTTAAQTYGGTQDFGGDLRAQLARTGGEAVIFVHGYNTNMAEGVYRVAQFAHDLQLPGTVVLYSWPSAAEPLGYAYDRDSALSARDGLEALIHQVARAGAKKILLVAHSMGSGLTMEALRSASLRGDKATLRVLNGVILISPDIDVDVFREEALSMGKLPQPFVIFGSDRDKILRLSAALTGQEERLGSLSDVSRVADLEVTFLDVGEFAKGAGHFVVGDSAALIRMLERIVDVQGAFERDRKARIGLLPGVVLTVQNATQVILRPIGAVAQGLAQ
jgi:esterase/lipase superfamily enzyme